MKRVSFIVVTIILLTAVVLLGRSRFSHKANRLPENQTAVKSDSIDYTSHTLLKNVSVPRQKKLAEGRLPIAGMTSHHLPTAENFIDELYSQIKLARPNISTFFITGPDHFERCKLKASTTNKDFLTPFGVLENNQELTKILLQAGAGEDSSCFVAEHAIGVQTTFIKKYFPNAKITTLLFSSAASKEMAEKFAKIVYEANADIFIISSTDFSHYEPVASANRVDERTEAQIKSLDYSNIKLEQVDSPASFAFVISFAKLQEAKPEYITHANSFDFVGNPDNTTSYFNVIFTK